MISRLRGTLLEKEPSGLVVDVGGVGYGVLVPLTTLEELTGDTVDLFVHTEVREDAIQLFGFLRKTEREIFRRLTTVQGVGPMTALAVLSGLSLEALFLAIQSRDLRKLSGIPRIGRKSAERICLELGDKLDDLLADSTGESLLPAELRDALQALEHLGYRAKEAARALERARQETPEGPIEAWIRLALKDLAPK